MNSFDPNQYPSDPSPAEPVPPATRLALPLGKLFWTYLLLGMIIIIFLIEQTLPSFVNFLLPYLPPEYAGLTAVDFRGGSTNNFVLILLGGNFHPLVERGQVWRFFTSMFLHIGFQHLLFNAYALFIIAGETERFYGRTRFIAIYILSGLFGSSLSFAFSQAQLSAGASGAIFGAIGMQGAYFYKHKKLLGEFGRSRLMNVAFIVGINIFFGLSSPGIDNLAHMGGLLSGALLGYTMTPVYKIVGRYTDQPRVIDDSTFQSQLWVLLIAIAVLAAGTLVAL